MNRRNLLKSLAIIAAGSTVAIGCSPKDIIWEEGSTAIDIGSQSLGFINDLSQLILPVGDIEYDTREPLGKFVQTMVNDCRSSEEIVMFGKGYDEYKLYLKEVLKKDLNDLGETEIDELFATVKDESQMTENARYFFDQMRGLSIQHFTSTEYYLKQYTKYEMIPSRFNGCAPIA